jgi:hypothetical protein
VFYEGKNGQKTGQESRNRRNSCARRAAKKYFYFSGFFRPPFFLKRCHCLVAPPSLLDPTRQTASSHPGLSLLFGVYSLPRVLTAEEEANRRMSINRTANAEVKSPEN